MTPRVTFVSRCKAEKLAAASTASEVDKLLAVMGCAVPGAAAFSVRKEAAAAIVWMRAHKEDTAEQFDALPEAGREELKGLYRVLPDAQGMHWSKKIFRLLHAFSAADSPVKAGQAPPEQVLAAVGDLGLGDDQSRPEEDDGFGPDADREHEARARRVAQRQREDDQMLAVGIELYIYEYI